MAVRNPYLEYLVEWMAPLGAITARSMMGGHVLYCDGVVFALVASATLYLKVDDGTRASFEAIGAEPFRPFESVTGTMQYYPPPATFFDNADVMLGWGRAAVEVGRRAQAKKKRKR